MMPRWRRSPPSTPSGEGQVATGETPSGAPRGAPSGPAPSYASSMAKAGRTQSNPWLSRRVLGWAHQGGGAEGPPNTLQAMRHAVAQGIHALELDVHLTGDGEVVLHHDAAVTAGGERLAIAESGLDRLRAAKPDLATLDEVIAAFPSVPLTVEVKSPQAAGPAARLLAGGDPDRPMIMTSFDRGTVSTIKRVAPNLDTAPAWPTVLALWALSRVRLAAPAGGGHVAVQVSPRLDQTAVVKRIPGLRNLRVLDRRFVDAAHRRGLAVHAWTLDHEADILQALDAGADGIMTDRPTVLMRVLKNRGVAWSPAGSEPPEA